MTRSNLRPRRSSCAVEDAGLRKEDIDGLLVNTGRHAARRDGRRRAAERPGPRQPAPAFKHERRRRDGERDGAVRRDVRNPRPRQPRRLRLRRRAAARKPAAAAALRTARWGGRSGRSGMGGLYTAFGVFGVNAHYALAARRHMAMYGTTSDQLGAIAVAERAVGARRTRSPSIREPMTLEDYRHSRWVVEPLHLLDCCLVSNGGVAVIVIARGRGARDLKQPPAYVLGMGQGHPGDLRRRAGTSRPRPARRSRRRRASRWPASTSRTSTSASCTTATRTPCWSRSRITASARRAKAGLRRRRQAGAGRQSADEHRRRRASAYYMWGMTPLSEGVIQARGQGGERQVAEARRRAGHRQRRDPRPPLDAGAWVEGIGVTASRSRGPNSRARTSGDFAAHVAVG